jgi:hypothetical protein
MMIQLTFIHEHETRRMSRYSETLPGDVVRSLYLDTNSLRQEFGIIPGTLIITIETKE